MKKPSNPLVFKLPERQCVHCRRWFKVNPNKPFTCCSPECQREHAIEIARIAKADKTSDYPF